MVSVFGKKTGSPSLGSLIGSLLEPSPSHKIRREILEYFRDTEFSKPLEILASWDHLLDDLEIINAFSQNYRRLNII